MADDFTPESLQRAASSQPRQFIAVRLSADGVAWLDAEAAARGMNRSEVFRAMLAYAQDHMPEDFDSSSLTEDERSFF